MRSALLRATVRLRFAVAEDHVADAVFVVVYGIRRAPRLRISATTTLAYLCGVAGTSGAGTGGAARGRPVWRPGAAYAP